MSSDFGDLDSILGIHDVSMNSISNEDLARELNIPLTHTLDYSSLDTRHNGDNVNYNSIHMGLNKHGHNRFEAVSREKNSILTNGSEPKKKDV